jgi:hypothetical protein
MSGDDDDDDDDDGDGSFVGVHAPTTCRGISIATIDASNVGYIVLYLMRLCIRHCRLRLRQVLSNNQPFPNRRQLILNGMGEG